MAVGAFQIYEKGLLSLVNGTVDFAADTIKAALLDTTHVVDVPLDEFFSDVSADECVNGDYAQLTLTAKTLTIVANKIRFDCADLDFGNAVSISARYLVIYKDTTVPATSNLLFIQDLNTGGGNLSSTASDFDIAISVSGIYEITPNV